MKALRNLTAALLTVLVPAQSAFAQQISQDIEVVIMPSGEAMLHWFAKNGRTYFIQASDPNDHLRTWIWSDLIEYGRAHEISHEVGTTSDKGFFRLHYTDTPPPAGVTLEDWDADGDGLPNALELSLQANPLNNDTNGDGIPDGWVHAHGLLPAANIATGLFNGGPATNLQAFQQGVQAHTAATIDDHDGDGLENDADADPQDADVDWERANVGGYALVEIDVPAEAGFLRDMNNEGEVLFSGGIWAKGQWTPIQYADDVIIAPSGVAWNVEYNGLSYFNDNGHVLTSATLGREDWDGSIISPVCIKPLQTAPAVVISTADYWDFSYYVTQSTNIGVSEAGDMFVRMSLDSEPGYIYKFNSDGVPIAQLGGTDRFHPNPGYYGHAAVSESGWVASNTGRKATQGVPAAYRVGLWNPSNQFVELPEEASGWAYPVFISDLARGKTILVAGQSDAESHVGRVFLPDSDGGFKYASKLSGNKIHTFAGDGTAMTSDGKLWINGKLNALRNLCPAFGDLWDEGWFIRVHKANKHGGYLISAYNEDQTIIRPHLLLPIELNSKDRLVQGAVEIPDGWQDFSLSFKNKTTGEDLGTYENLEPGASTEVMIYNDSEDFFSDKEMAEASSGTLPDNARNQKVAFARDPENERRLRFCTLFDGLGEVEIKLAFGPNQTEGIAGITLTRDELMASFISSVNEKVLSIEVPGGDETPVDIDGDGTPDGEGSGQETGDILQGFNAGTMAKPGAPVWDEHEENPQNLVLAINDDNDDHGGAGHVDNSDTVISAADNDIATLLLKVPANIQGDTGTMTLTVSGGSGVRVFNANGTALLSDYSVNLAEPSGDLSPLAIERRVKILVEGIEAASSMTFTLTCSDAEGQPLASDTVKMMVVPRDQLVWLNAESMIQTAYGDPSRAMFRTYADNGAAQWHPNSLALIGEEPVIRNRGMLAKVFLDIPINAAKKEIAWHLGYINGFWIALKGEYETVAGVWEFFSDDPYSRSAAAWAAGKEAVAILRAMPEDELEQALKDISANLTSDLYTAAENNLPWQPIGGALSPDVLQYMGGFAAGTVSEAVAISLTGAGLVAKVGTTVRGIVAGAKAGQYSLAALNSLRKATLKTTHILLQLARTREEAAAIGTIGKYLGKVDFPSGKKAAERFAEAFHDKPDLTKRFLGKYHDHWNDLPEARRVVRYKLAIRRVAELKELMGNTLSDDALEGFGILQKKLFKEGVDDSDRFNDLVGLWKDLDSPAKKQSLDDSLAAYKQAVQNDPDAKFLFHQIDQVYDYLYHYIPESDFKFISAQGGGRFQKDVFADGHYVSPFETNDSTLAKVKSQLPPKAGFVDSERARYRIRIQSDQFSGDTLEVPRAYDHANGSVAAHIEPIAKDNPQFGIGGAPQLKTPRGLATTEIYDSALGRILSESEIFNLIQKWK